MVTVDELILNVPDLTGLIPDNAIFLDIETTGLSARTAGLYLIGVTYKNEQGWRYRQWFANSQREEMEVLAACAEFAKPYQTLVHFNGTTFDLPFLRSCSKQYHMELGLDEKESMDLYSLLRPMGTFLGMKQMKQKSFEERIGLHREDQYTGGELIEVYKTYEKAPTNEARDILLLHNRDDLIGMLSVARALSYEKLLRQPLKLLEVKEEEQLAVISLQAEGGLGVPAPAEASSEDFEIYVESRNITVRVRAKDGAVRYFFPDYQNYFYLPHEDKAIHKSVGIYVDSHFRQKAAYETAYQWVKLELLTKKPEQMDSYVHRLFEHYIFDKKASKGRK